jgi:predicted RNA polymerase sigma factor
VVALNRAVAVGQAQGPQADVLERLGRLPEASAAYLRAAALSDNAVQQQLLRERAQRIRPAESGA